MRTSTRTVLNSRQELQTLVLASLGTGNRHGYAIRKDIEETFGRIVGQGALYGALKALLGRA